MMTPPLLLKPSWRLRHCLLLNVHFMPIMSGILVNAVGDIEPSTMNASSSDVLPEGLARELPTADARQNLSVARSADASMEDLDDLREQFEALGAD